MKLYILIIYCFFIVACNFKNERAKKTLSNTTEDLYESEPKNDIIVNVEKWDTVRGYFNDDEKEDLILSNYNTTKGEFYYKILFQKENDYLISKTNTINDDFSYLINEGQGAVFIYRNEINRSYGIRISCCANHKELEDYIYKYNDEKQQWDLIKLMEYTYFPLVSFKMTYPTNMKPTNLNDSFNKLYNESKIRFKNNDIKWIENELNDLFLLGEIIENVPIDSSNLVKYNDIAYFLEQTGKGDPLAVYILEKIIKQFPERTVAYINLGDAYWGTNQEEKAKATYNEYISQMTEQGKTSKIPKRVMERTK